MNDITDVERLQRRLARERSARLEAERIAEAATLVSVQDPLTGLASRRLVMQTIERELARAMRREAQVAILYIDLDGFKLINDNYGHAVGDRVLIAVADALRGAMRASDVAGRLGGDEFLIVAPDLDNNAAIGLACRLMEAVDAASRSTPGTVEVRASIGITLADGSVDAESAVQQADRAMYAAKESDELSWRLFDPALRTHIDRQRGVHRELPGAIERRELMAHYQPIIEIASGSITALEALARWPRGDGSMRLPADFLPSALQPGLIDRFGELMLDLALGDLRRLRTRRTAAGHLDWPQIAVNVSPRRLGSPGFAASMEEALGSAELSGADLIVEVTEQAILDSSSTTEKNLLDLQRLGVALSLDDFGTGYSSLARLRTHDFIELKIDRTFIVNIAASLDDRAIVSAVVAMAHALGARVVAEGVEDADQLAIVADLGCDRAQGWHFSPAVELDAVAELLNVGF